MRRRQAPLRPDELTAVVEAADRLSARHKLLTHVIPYTGLDYNELIHLRRDWLVKTEDDITIHVPPSAPCEQYHRKPSSGVQYVRRDKNCFACRQKGRDKWRPTGESRIRSIPVIDDVAVLQLEDWFSRFDAIPMSPRSPVGKLCDEVADEAGVEPFGTVALRQTYTARLITAGVDPDTIVDVCGYHRKYKLEPVYDAIGEEPPWDVGKAEQFTPDEYLEALDRFVERLGRLPETSDIESDQFEYSFKPYYNHFGGLHPALEELGYDPSQVSVTREDLIADLRRLADELGQPPTTRDIDDHGQYSPKPYYREFGSIPEARRAAGVDGTRVLVTREDLIADLRRLADELGRPPTKRDINDHGQYSSRPYYREFGSIPDARRAADVDELPV